jgi:hypothetical protein
VRINANIYIYISNAGDAPGDDVAGGTELVLAGLGAGGGAGGGLPAWSLAATQVCSTTAILYTQRSAAQVIAV